MACWWVGLLCRLRPAAFFLLSGPLVGGAVLEVLVAV